MEIDKIKKQETEVVSEQKKQVEYKKIGTLRRIPGLTLFRFNLTTHELSKVDMEAKQVINMHGKVVSKYKAEHEKGCIYLQCLNFKNAERRIKSHICNEVIIKK